MLGKLKRVPRAGDFALFPVSELPIVKSTCGFNLDDAQKFPKLFQRELKA